MSSRVYFLILIITVGCSSAISGERNSLIDEHSINNQFVNDGIDVVIFFSKVIPNIDVFIDKTLYTTTSTNGDAKIEGSTLSPGKHKITLRKNNKIIKESEIELETGSKQPVAVKCSGVEKLTCKDLRNKD